MFLFQISSYDDPALDGETEELLRQRMEAHSRRAMSGIWKATDALNSYTDKGPGREKRQGRYRVYGVVLLALGVFVLVPGLAEPRVPILILAGIIAIIAGLLSFFLSGKGRTAGVPASCKNEAKKLLAGRRAIDWRKAAAKIDFDETGITVTSGESREIIPYAQIAEVFESENLWLLMYHGERALLLQKKDLVSGDAAMFTSFIFQKTASKP